MATTEDYDMARDRISGDVHANRQRDKFHPTLPDGIATPRRGPKWAARPCSQLRRVSSLEPKHGSTMKGVS